MRRAAHLGLVAALGLGAVATSSAGAQTPTAQFSSPRTAVAGAPVWLRSVDPCPIVAGAYQYVVAGFAPQVTPEGEPAGEVKDSTTADLRPDGSWEVTVSAPNDFIEGTTKSFTVHADCVMVSDPYLLPDEGGAADGGDGGATLPRLVSLQRYELRPLYVTGAMASTSADAEAVTTTSVPETTTTTALTSPTTLTTLLPTPTTAASTTFDEQAAPSTGGSSAWHDDPVSAGDVRRELELRQPVDRAVAFATPAAATTAAPAATADAGVPWWAFALAAVLAVSGIVGYGVRRTGTA